MRAAQARLSTPAGQRLTRQRHQPAALGPVFRHAAPQCRSSCGGTAPPLSCTRPQRQATREEMLYVSTCMEFPVRAGARGARALSCRGEDSRWGWGPSLTTPDDVALPVGHTRITRGGGSWWPSAREHSGSDAMPHANAAHGLGLAEPDHQPHQHVRSALCDPVSTVVWSPGIVHQRQSPGAQNALPHTQRKPGRAGSREVGGGGNLREYHVCAMIQGEGGPRQPTCSRAGARHGNPS